MALGQLKSAGIDVRVHLFVTCDPTCAETSDDGSKGTSEVCKCGDTTSAGEKCGCCDSSPEIINSAPPSDSHPRRPRYRWASVTRGRPNWHALLNEIVEQAHGESAIGACGPPTFCASVRNTVVRISDHRAVNKGSGAQGIYLHVESAP